MNIKETLQALQGTSVTELYLNNEDVEINIIREQDEIPMTKESKDNLIIIESKEIGTFRSRVAIQEKVNNNQVIGSIEAMTINNDVKSTTEGTTQEVFVSQESPVMFRQKLFSITPL